MAALKRIVLINSFGMQVDILNFGARIAAIKFPVNGQPTDMILSYDDNEDYLNDAFYLGATCGRVCNRIDQASFSIAGREYVLEKSDGENCLHGGIDTFAHRYWQVTHQSPQAVTLVLHSADGDQGFPGAVDIQVTYTLTDDNALTIDFVANTNMATPINLTNHAYFNLGEADARSLTLQINAPHYLALNKRNIPTGELVPVANTDFDFNTARVIGAVEATTHDAQVIERRGFDHCFALVKRLPEQPAATLTSAKNQLSMTLYTDQKAVQLYSGAYLSTPFQAYQGLCLEAQNFTDAVNHPSFPNTVLEPAQQYRQRIAFAFTAHDVSS